MKIHNKIACRIKFDIYLSDFINITTKSSGVLNNIVFVFVIGPQEATQNFAFDKGELSINMVYRYCTVHALGVPAYY